MIQVHTTDALLGTKESHTTDAQVISTTRMFIFITNSVVVDGRRKPSIPDDIPYVCHVYQKTGNVFKFLVKTPNNLAGLPGVFGPISHAQIEAALTADNAQSLHGWNVTEVPDWALGGRSDVEGDPRELRHRTSAILASWARHTTDAVVGGG